MNSSRIKGKKTNVNKLREIKRYIREIKTECYYNKKEKRRVKAKLIKNVIVEMKNSADSIENEDG